MSTAGLRIMWKASGLFRTAIRSFSGKIENFLNRGCVENVGREFALSDDVLVDVMHRMSEATDRALRSADPSGSTIMCSDTHLDLPPAVATANAKAARRFLSLDMTDSIHFRTRLTTVPQTGGPVKILSKEYPMPDGMRTGPGYELFNGAADVLARVAGLHGVSASRLPLAFTFGFPVRQTALDAAVLRRWTKEFDCANVVNHDVADELRDALCHADVNVGPMAVMNDACVAMLNSLPTLPATRVGLVMDNGCNCCYAERAVNFRGRRRTLSSATDQMIVNTEWGAFGENGVIDYVKTKYDRDLDARSRYPGKQIFEKMTSGMYMAELVRQLVLELATKQVLFRGRVTPAMKTEYVLKAFHLSRTESDPRDSLMNGRTVLIEVLGMENPTDMDCKLFRYACECITKRSAHLIAAGLSSILLRLEPVPGTFVAVDGTMFHTHPTYASMVGHMTKRLIIKNNKDHMSFGLRTVEHHGGAALMAGILAGMTAGRNY